MSCEICHNLNYKNGYGSSTFLDGSSKIPCGMEMILDDNNGKPDLFIHAYFLDECNNFNNMVFSNLHYCPRCGEKLV